MKILGIETSCDETAVAIVDGKNILSSVVASQNDIHAKFGGIVPELASRRHAEVISILLKQAVLEASTPLTDIFGIAVTKSPGLIGALLVGLSAAKAIAYSLGIPLIGVNHLEGHINAAALSAKELPYPHIGLIVSGGHTSLYLVEGFGKYKLLGATRDDAAGEAFDKVARLLELGYPGGPIIDKLAAIGNPKAVKFKKPRFRDMSEFDFSFSGIKTAVMLHYKKLTEGNRRVQEKTIADIAASFQRSVVEALIDRIVAATKKYSCKNVVVSGGVAANNGLREALNNSKNVRQLDVFVPPADLCTDNAAMIAYVGGRRLQMGEKDSFDLNAVAVEEIGL